MQCWNCPNPACSAVGIADVTNAGVPSRLAVWQSDGAGIRTQYHVSTVLDYGMLGDSGAFTGGMFLDLPLLAIFASRSLLALRDKVQTLHMDNLAAFYKHDARTRG